MEIGKTCSKQIIAESISIWVFNFDLLNSLSFLKKSFVENLINRRRLAIDCQSTVDFSGLRTNSIGTKGTDWKNRQISNCQHDRLLKINFHTPFIFAVGQGWSVWWSWIVKFHNALCEWMHWMDYIGDKTAIDFATTSNIDFKFE